MRASCLLLAALAGTAFSTPVVKRQDIDFDAYDSTYQAPDQAPPVGLPEPTVVNYNPTAAAAAAAADATSGALEKRSEMAKRGTCQPNLSNANPDYQVRSPDTPEAFQAFLPFADAARNAPTPEGFILADNFRNLINSAKGPSYRTYTTVGLTSYTPAVCAAKCKSLTGCVSFNIYYERLPNIDLDRVLCPDAANSVTIIKCGFFGSVISSVDATNAGQFQGRNFSIVHAGSNGYTTGPNPVTCYSGPNYLDNAIIRVDGDPSYMGLQTFPTDQPYDPSVCAEACNAKSVYNVQHPPTDGSTPRICRFFDAFILYKNGLNGVFTCMYYTRSWDASYATNTGQYNAAGDHFTIAHSYTYSLTDDSCSGVN